MGHATFLIHKDNFMIKPVNQNIIPSLLKISGFDWPTLKLNGLAPNEAMVRFAEWIGHVSNNTESIFVAPNTPFDWMFVNDYSHDYLGHNTYGHKALDIKAFYMGLHKFLGPRQE